MPIKLAELNHATYPSDKVEAQKRGKLLAQYLKQEIGGEWSASVKKVYEWWLDASCGTMEVEETNNNRFQCSIKNKKGGSVMWQSGENKDPAKCVRSAMAEMKRDAQMRNEVMAENFDLVEKDILKKKIPM